MQSKGITIVPPEIVELVEHRQSLAAAYREYNQINDQLKAFWKKAEEGEYYCGDYIAIVKRTKDTEVQAKDAYTRKGFIKTTYKKRSL
jgi:hypothetical protein